MSSGVPPTTTSPWEYRILERARKITVKRFLPMILPVRVFGRDFSDREVSLYGVDANIVNWDPNGVGQGAFTAELRTDAYAAHLVRLQIAIVDANGDRMRNGFVSLRVNPLPSPWSFDLSGPTAQALQLYGIAGPISQTTLYIGESSATPVGYDPFNLPSDAVVELSPESPLFVGPSQSLSVHAFLGADSGVAPYTVSFSFIWREPEVART